MRLVKVIRINVSASGGQAVVADGQAFDEGAVAVIAVTGSDVTVRMISDRDPVLGRIMQNADLLRTSYTDRVCYIGKEEVMRAVESIGGIHIAGIVVGDGNPDMDSEIETIERGLVSIDKLKKDRPLLEAVCGQWYRKLKMPVLLFYLGLLIINFLTFSSVGKKYEEKRREVEAFERRSRTEVEATERQKKMVNDFLAASSGRTATGFDKIGASVPEGIRLTHISVEGDGFRIKGEAGDASSVVDLTERLGNYFSSLKMHSFDRVPGQKICRFDLNVSR